MTDVPFDLPRTSTRAFRDDAERAISRLRAAMVRVFEALPTYPRRAPDLTRQLGVERNLAWKLFRLAHEPDALSAARFVPGDASIEAFVIGAKRAGVAASLVDDVLSAARAYIGVVRVHAGDRASAGIMLGGTGGDGAELALRRAAFRASSSLAGVQAATQAQVFFLAPSRDNPEVMDGAALRGFVDLQRMRPDAPVVIGRSVATDDAGGVAGMPVAQPIDGPLSAGEHVPLLRSFCSSPAPVFRRVAGERGFMEDELAEGPVGRTGAITFMSGDVMRCIGSKWADERNAKMEMVTRLRTPVSVFVCDLFVHTGLFGVIEPEVAVYSDLVGEAMLRGPGRDRYRLPSSLHVERLGSGVSAPALSDVPRYLGMLCHVFDRLGWNGDEFEGYRVRMDFPMVPTSVVLAFPLPNSM